MKKNNKSRNIFRLSLLPVGCILIFLTWYYTDGKYRRDMGDGPAGPEIPREPFKSVWSEDRYILLGLGDSITDGFGSSKYKGYLNVLYENDADLYPDMQGIDLSAVFPDLTLLNYAVSYTTSYEHIKNQLPLIKTFDEGIKGIVTITSGGNDLIHDYGKSTPCNGAMYGCTYEQALLWRESFRNRIKTIIDEIMSRFPGGCEIFLANYYDPTDGEGDIENAHILLPGRPEGLKVLELYNDTIAGICSSYENVHLVDLHGTFLGHGIHYDDKNSEHYNKEDPHFWYHPIIEDPNDRGYDAVRRAFLLEIMEETGRR